MKKNELRRHIELRRHSVKGPGDVLSPEGFELARRVGKTMRDKRYTHFIVSPYFRTLQTLVAFSEGAGDFPPTPEIRVEPGLFTTRLSEWREAGGDIRKILESDRSKLVEEEGKRLKNLLLEILEEIPPDGRVLIIGHSPILECAVYALTGQLISPLRECEGVELQYDLDGRIKMKELRL